VTIRELLGREVIVLDGSMGAFLQAQGLPAGTPPDLWNLQRAGTVRAAHRQYVDAGARVVLTNTFGGTAPRLDAHGAGTQVAEINRAAVHNARRAGAEFVAGDIGPLGLSLEPVGDLAFAKAIRLFSEQIRTLLDEGVDLLLAETFIDLHELRAAVIAANDLRGDVPLVASMTFGADGVSDTGDTPEAAAVTLEGLGVDAVGVNCSVGPEEMLPVVRRLAASTALPIAVQPNAGLPRQEEDRMVFPLQPVQMAPWYERFVDAGAGLVGGCCGTTPQTIELVARSVGGRPVASRPSPTSALRLASRSRVVAVGPGEPFALIGERINPTGKPRFATALRQGRFDRVIGAARSQTRAGASALDVNVGTHGVDEPATMGRAVAAVSNAVDLPLVLDSSDPAAIERGLAVYPGRALVNSVNAEGDPGNALRMVRRHGAAVLLLPTGEDIPETVAGRLRYAERLVDQALAAGFHRSDLVVDILALAASAMPEGARNALGAARAYREQLGTATICGLSNISFGLPRRKLVNRAFLAMAVGAGLDAAIADPLDSELMDAVRAAALFSGRDPGCARFLETFSGVETGAKPRTPPSRRAPVRERLGAAVMDGDREVSGQLAAEALAEGSEALDLLLQTLTPAIQTIGEQFARRERFIPHLIAGAEAMQSAVAVLEPHLTAADRGRRGTVVFGTVAGDVHDIGKNICVLMLRSFGFDVVDLGRSVDAERFVEAAVQHDAAVVAMSALMTTTMGQMKVVIDLLRESGSRARTLVGGAVVTPEAARDMGADAYGADAGAVVEEAEALIAEQ